MRSRLTRLGLMPVLASIRYAQSSRNAAGISNLSIKDEFALPIPPDVLLAANWPLIEEKERPIPMIINGSAGKKRSPRLRSKPASG